DGGVVHTVICSSSDLISLQQQHLVLCVCAVLVLIRDLHGDRWIRRLAAVLCLWRLRLSPQLNGSARAWCVIRSLRYGMHPQQRRQQRYVSPRLLDEGTLRPP
ncbi:unnamed protein product, partial [Ectocarpus sp. 12 AP-2014]